MKLEDSNATTRRVAYSLAAGAAAGMAGSADAAINYSGVQDVGVVLGANAYQLNLDGDAFDDLKLMNYAFGGGSYQGLYVNFFPGKVVGTNNPFPSIDYASALSSGDLITASATAGGPFQGSMAYGANNPNAEFNNAIGAFIGLEFPIGGVNHFGWVRVTIDNAAGSFVINDWAYNTVAGEPIRAGQIPEPTALGLLAAGAAGVAAMRRRRSA